MQEDIINKVGSYYDVTTYDYETIRLEKDSPIEYAITLRKLQQYIDNNSIVADVGVGCGHYAEYLAKKNCQLYLVDVSERLLKTTQNRLQHANLNSHVLSATLASATQLAFIEDNSLDVVLLLGPLYHLQDENLRQQAVAESARILKKGGLLFAAGINRLTFFRELWNPERYNLGSQKLQPSNNLERYKQMLATGNVDEKFFPGALAKGHLTTVSEFYDLFTAFEPLEFLGVESFTGHHQQRFCEKTPADQEAWLDLVELTGKMSEGRATAEHFLYIGRKP
jgi:ubiquinone/menaquinone biosynthesis C-methylase UbiE